ncbi:MAG: hypothetical protein UU27_C0019G0013, partial [Parcubacteria group bacterium GW2011_GWD1_40_9]
PPLHFLLSTKHDEVFPRDFTKTHPCPLFPRQSDVLLCKVACPRDKREPHKYKLGAMLLDLNNPTKILYRSKHAILSPEMHYENDGKPGVIYASGAVIRGDDLYVYYGGGDKVVCVATTPLKEFLNYLITGNPDSYELKRVV